MSFPLSRILSASTAAYAVFALVKPEHLGSALDAPKEQMPGFDLVAYTYAARDLPVSLVGMFATSPTLVNAAMLMRIASDFGDAAILGFSMDDPAIRKKALTVTIAWGALNSVGLLIDRRSRA